jgi:chloramphenicol 3-O phosphotransferase
LTGLPVLFVGVHCPIDVIWQRREQSWGQKRETADDELLPAVGCWLNHVHAHDPYDLDVDTSVPSPPPCAESVAARLHEGGGLAFQRLADGYAPVPWRASHWWRSWRYTARRHQSAWDTARQVPVGLRLWGTQTPIRP